MLLAKRIYFRADLIADPTCFFQPFLARPGEFRRVVKRPMQPSSYAGKNRAPFSFSFATHHYHELEQLA